jgi:hypothetical protein
MAVGSFIRTGWRALRRLLVERLADRRRRRSCASIAFAPTERLSAHQLCGCLLSANLAVLAQDNFNQLASALSPRRARRMLEHHWGLKSAFACRRCLESRLARLSIALPDEAKAFAAWCDRAVRKSDTHLSKLAWDIQQVAHMARLGLSAGYVSREVVESTLTRLQHAVRAQYPTWSDYSLLALKGWSLRAHRGERASASWQRIRETHRVLLEAPDSPIHRVAFCDGPLLPRRGANSPSHLEPHRSGTR